MITLEKFIERSKEVHGNKYDYSKVHYNHITDKVCIICPIHGEFWQSARQHYRGQGCPICGREKLADTQKDTQEEFIEKFKKVHGDKYDLSKVEYVNSVTPVTIICPEHGEFKMRPNYLLNGRGCPTCGNSKKGSFRKLNEEDVKEKILKKFPNYDTSKIHYKSLKDKIIIGCPIHGYYESVPYSLMIGHGCPKCASEQQSTRQMKTTEQFIKEAMSVHGDKYDYSETIYRGAFEPVTIICKKHGPFQQKPTNHLSGCGCQECGKLESKYEKEIIEFIESIYSGEIKKHNRWFLKGQEIDIVIPEKKLAIEFDGLYWHSEAQIPERNYHLNKTKACETYGYQLIHIFEDEWIYKQDICKSRIKNLLGCNDVKIYARLCEIRDVSGHTIKDFLNTNHIQGAAKNIYSGYGLYYNDELISVMAFSKLRINLGQKPKEGEYELLRFCSKLGVSVVGGAGKLFKHFINTVKPTKVISYADRRWSMGKIYETLGFTFSHNSIPSYFYVFGDKRENRFKYRKNELIRKYGCPPEVSEHDFCLSKKWYRIYDCGTKVYIWENKKPVE